MMNTSTPSSEIDIKYINDKSVLTGSKIARPLKIFSLQHDSACQIIFSNYGGGFVEGDHILLNLSCGADTVSVFSSQANTRVYKSERDLTSSQEIHATLGRNAFAAFLCDPLVPHMGSIFEQRQLWNIEEGAVLLFTDWFVGGRILNGERFAFQSYHSEFKVQSGDTPLVWDKFFINPSQNNPDSPGVFLNHSCYVNIFLVGHDSLPRVQRLAGILNKISETHLQNKNTLVATESKLMGSYAKVNENISMIRCAAKSNEMLEPLMKELSLALSHQELLGFNPDHKL